MLTRIEIDGFKSFTNFSMEFSPLTIIAGLNASGKSNLFDALHLLSLLAEKPLAEAFDDESQRGRNLELFTQYSEKEHAREVRFGVEMVVDKVEGENAAGQAILLASHVRMRYQLAISRIETEHGIEDLAVREEWLQEIGAPHPFIQTESHSRAIQEWPDGSKADILSDSVRRTALAYSNSAFRHPYTLAAKEEIRSWVFPQLDPKVLARSSPSQVYSLPGTLNALADNLAGVFWRLSKTDPYLLTRITQRLASLVPGIKEIVVRHDDYYNQYRVFVHTTAGQRFPLHLLSEGTLRMLALCTLAFDDQQHGVLGLEEPENGVHPGLLKRVAELLRDLSTNEPPEEGQEPWPLRQVIVNTHSPGLIKACLEAAAGQEGGGKSDLTVWFSQLVGRTVEEDGKRVMRRVTDMLPVVLPENGALPPETGKRVALAQLVNFLESANSDELLKDLGLQPIVEAL